MDVKRARVALNKVTGETVVVKLLGTRPLKEDPTDMHWFVDVSFPYDARLVAAIKQWPGCAWQSTTKSWRIPVEVLLQLRVEARRRGFATSPLPQGEAPSKGMLQINLQTIALHDYQRAGISAALRSGRWIFNDEVGVGKTAQAITACRQLGARKILILCPAIVRSNWVAELDKWWPEHPGAEVLDTGLLALSSQTSIQIASYNLAEALLHKTEPMKWDAIILDECHRLANPGAGWSKAVKELCGRHKGAIFGLTATLMPNRPVDVWNVVDTIWPGRFGEGKGNYRNWKFCQHYSNGTHNGYGWQFKGVNLLHVEELKQRIEALSSRTTREAIAHLLPAFDVQMLDVKDGEKQDRIEEWLEGACEETSHVCLLTHLRASADRLARMLEPRRKDGWAVYLIDGSTPPTQRAKDLEEMKRQPKAILVATMHSIGIGIDLTCCTRTLFTELYWRPETMLQTLGRFSRLSGKAPNRCDILVMEGSEDEKVAESLRAKIAAINSAIKAGQMDKALPAALHASDKTLEEVLAALVASVSGPENNTASAKEIDSSAYFE